LAALSERYGHPEKVYAALAGEKLTEFQRTAITGHEKQASLNWQLIKLRSDLTPIMSVGSAAADKLAECLMQYEIKRISADKFVGLFGSEDQFLERKSQPMEVYSLF
jgi:hypothetical protein